MKSGITLKVWAIMGQSPNDVHVMIQNNLNICQSFTEQCEKGNVLSWYAKAIFKIIQDFGLYTKKTLILYL